MLYQVTTPIIQPRMRFFDADGKPLVGGKVYSFKVGTTQFKPTYRDANKTALNTNPIVLDADGSALIYLNGAHVLKVYDRDGNLIESRYVPETQMRTQFFDKYGVPLKNGKVWTYDIASTIKKPSYINADKNQPNTNPVVLDAEGWASISMLGSYRLRSYNEKGVSTGDQDFRRPVAKALTSKVYPIYFEESIATDFIVKHSILAEAAQLTENIGTSVVVKNAQYISEIIYLSYSMEAESIQSSFVVGNAQYVSETLYRNISDEISVSTAFSVKDVEIRDNRVEYNAGNESVKTSFLVGNAQYIQES